MKYNSRLLCFVRTTLYGIIINTSTNFVFFIYESGCYNFTSWQVLGPGSTSGSILMQGPKQPWTNQSMLQVMKYQQYNISGKCKFEYFSITVCICCCLVYSQFCQWLTLYIPEHYLLDSRILLIIKQHSLLNQCYLPG